MPDRIAHQPQRLRVGRVGQAAVIAGHVEPPGHSHQFGIGKALAVIVEQRQPAHQAHPHGVALAAFGEGGDIVRLPVEAPGEVGERDRVGPAVGIAGIDGEHRLRRQAHRHPVERQLLGQAGAAHRLEALAGLQHQPAVRPGADDRAFALLLAGRGIGAGNGNAIAERAVDQRRRAQQFGVAVLLDRPARQAADDGGDRDHPFGDAFEADRRFAGRKGDLPRFADHRETLRPVAVHRPPLAAVGIAVEGDGERLWGGGIDHLARGGWGGEKSKQEEQDYSPEFAIASKAEAKLALANQSRAVRCGPGLPRDLRSLAMTKEIWREHSRLLSTASRT